MKNFTIILTVFIILYNTTFSQEKLNQSNQLLIRCDDIGMCHAVNMACKKLIDAGIKFSASVMFPCSWYQEAVEILRDQPNVSIGVHLTLNSEWKNYRWGPVAGAKAVPSLVDSCGYFFPSRKTFNANNPTLEDIETELRAQIDRAMKSGLKIDYLDYHMGTAVEKPEYRAIVEKLAAEYNLAISRYFGEIDIKNVYDSKLDEKDKDLISRLNEPFNGTAGLLVCHIGLDTDEMQAMIDMNPTGLKEMSKHRQAELNALLNPEFLKVIKEKNIKLINYKDLINTIGLENMKRPW